MRMISSHAVYPIITFASYPEWLKESIVIILALGLLEVVLWVFSSKVLEEQTSIMKRQEELLEELVVYLSTKEDDEPLFERLVITPAQAQHMDKMQTMRNY